MDLFLYWLPIFGALLLGSFCLYALSVGNKKAAAWHAGLGLGCFVLLFALQLVQANFRDGTPVIDTHNADGPVVHLDRFSFDEIAPSRDQPGALELRPVIKNSGRTPALNVKLSVNLSGKRQLLPADFDYADVQGAPAPPAAILASGQELEVLPFKVRADYLEHVRHGRAYLFLYGWIEYDDRLAGTERHRTEFCWRAEVSQDASQGVLILTQYGPYNCIDKGCRYAPDRPPPKRPGGKSDYMTVIE